MGVAREALAARLVVGLLSPHATLMERVTEELRVHFGPPDYVGPLMPFTHTTYYDDELGPGIMRCFVSFAGDYPPGRLAGTKGLTNSLEQLHALDGRRQINIDPGYITLGKLVLATTKDQAHRIYLADGIYAEVTLAFRAGRFQPWPWTYPDYRSPEYLAVFNQLRARLAKKCRQKADREPRSAP